MGPGIEDGRCGDDPDAGLGEELGSLLSHDDLERRLQVGRLGLAGKGPPRRGAQGRDRRALLERPCGTAAQPGTADDQRAGTQVAQPIAELLGIPELIACEGETVDGRYTGEPRGVPSYHAGKVTRLQAWLAERDISLDGAFFYSDSHNDLPLLKLVDNPVAVDPDDRLRSYAVQKGWPVISLRD